MIGIEIKNDFLKKKNELEVVDMCKAWDDHWNSGEEIGKEIGLTTLVKTMKKMNMTIDEVHEEIITNEEYRDVTRSQIEKYYFVS